MATAVRGSGLADRIADQLARRGIAGRVDLDGATLRLEGHRQTVALDPQAIEHWADLDYDEQGRIVDRAVAQLLRPARPLDPKRTTSSSWLEWLKPMLVIAATGVGLWAAWQWLGRPARQALIGQNPSRSAPRPAEVIPSGGGQRAPEEGSAEHCRRVQSRIATGGSVSPLDVEGWLVEMIFLSHDAAFGPHSATLNTFLAAVPGKPSDLLTNGVGDVPDAARMARQLVWTEDIELQSVGASTSNATVATEALAEVVTGMRSGVRITWSGKLVERYFDESGRRHLHRLAAAIHEATDAAFGAVYARCAADTIHQIGTWFRGQDLASTALGMVAAMGYLDQGSPRGAPPDLGHNWERLLERIRRVDRQRLNLSLAEDGAMLATRPGRWVTVTFPFQDANRATRASQRLTRDLGVTRHP